MTILLYKDGRLVIDDDNPIEGNSLEGLVACVSDPQSGDTLKFDGKQWVAGAAASGLPAVSGDDNGKVLTVVEGEWAPAAGGGGGGTLIVEVTVGSNGETFNKTAGEIYEALEAGTFVLAKWPESEYRGATYAPIIEEYSYKTNGEISEIHFCVYNDGSGSGQGYTAFALNEYPFYSYD